MNKYLKNLNRLEFIVTMDCTGSCKHCSEGEHKKSGIHIDANRAREAVYAVFENYKLMSVMTFGGEPLLYPDTVYAIHQAAAEMNIPKRQLITNGYFSKDENKIRKVAKKLKECGVNDLLLSADSFHQETIPIDVVKLFAKEALKADLPVRLSPAWLVSREDENPYNIKTREIVDEFVKLGVAESFGNIIFPEGNAKKYLSEYFDKDRLYQNPYEEDPKNVKSISIEADGTLFGKSIYSENIMDILEAYEP